MDDRELQVKALSSEARRKILKLLTTPAEHFSHQESADPTSFGVCMNLIAESLGVSQPTASRHINLLRQAKLITVKKHKQWSYCLRDEAALTEYYQWMRAELGIQ